MRLAQDAKPGPLLQYGLIICVCALLTMGAFVLLDFAFPDTTGGIRQSRDVLIRLVSLRNPAADSESQATPD